MTTVVQTDLLIVGGGINGAGIARDAAGRGLSVLLCEQGDLAGATSSASSKLIHGGLRYLEYYEFRLVREALQEREVLLSIAPHIAWPMRFVLPHSREQRPAWLVRLGLFLYDHIGGRRSLPPTRRINLRRDLEGRPLRDDFRIAFEYSDAWVDDSRLVALNAMDAREHGADIRTRTRLVSARREPEGWAAEIIDVRTGQITTVKAAALVNAAGPWVADILNGRAGLNTDKRPRLVKGSHIILPRLYEGEHAYILQNDDRRVIFVIPYQGKFSLVGTTDIAFEGDPGKVVISPPEKEYLCRAVRRYFKAPIAPNDVVHSYSGVRPLYDDASANASAVTRDYVLDLDAGDGRAPILSVFGGKITTYRRLAEHAMDKLLPFLAPPRPAPWTGKAALPGGDMPNADFALFLATLQRTRPWLPADLAHRLARAYGARTAAILGAANSLAELGEDYGAGLTQNELAYMVREEWALTADDVLWRRSKLGLHLTAPQQARVTEAIDALVNVPQEPSVAEPTHILALDQGTTSTRAIVFDANGRPVATAQREFTQHYPNHGWVEHDPEDIWRDTLATARDAMDAAGVPVRAIGIANQRETVIVWDRATGAPVHPAIVWQDRRTAAACKTLQADGAEPLVRQRTGLLLDPYFSATKLAWILDNVPDARTRAERGELLFGTVDCFLLWRLTGGAVHATDATNASRTLLFDIHTCAWDAELLRLFRIPAAMLPDIRDNAGRLGQTAPGLFGAALPVAGMAGDQQAALIGQACFTPGLVKSTYGTGCFALMNTGDRPIASAHRMLTTLAYRLQGRPTYAIEGAIFVAGAAVKWLRDGIGLITHASQTHDMATQVADNHGVYMVPGFVGLGAPHWDPQARGLICGLTLDSNAAHIARAALESVAYQTHDLIGAMAADGGGAPRALRVDGGMAANDWFCQFLADMLDVPVERPAVLETTALGAAMLAGLGTGLYPNLAAAAAARAPDRLFHPAITQAQRQRMLAGWQGALAMALGKPRND